MSGSLWFELWSSAVSELNIQPTEAWKLTPEEFWKLWDNKLRKDRLSTPGQQQPMTLADLEELEEIANRVQSC